MEQTWHYVGKWQGCLYDAGKHIEYDAAMVKEEWTYRWKISMKESHNHLAWDLQKWLNPMLSVPKPPKKYQLLA